MYRIRQDRNGRERAEVLGEDNLLPTYGYHLRLCQLWWSYNHPILLQEDLLQRNLKRRLTAWSRKWCRFSRITWLRRVQKILLKSKHYISRSAAEKIHSAFRELDLNPESLVKIGIITYEAMIEAIGGLSVLIKGCINEDDSSKYLPVDSRSW